MLFLIEQTDNSKEFVCKSSNVLHIKYRTDIKKMTITYKSGKQYLYENIDDKIFNMFLKSDSIGKVVNSLFGKNVKGKEKYMEQMVQILNEDQLKYLYDIINKI